MKKTSLFLLTYWLLSLSTKAQVTKNVYFIGNSVTDAINYNGLDALVESRGNTHNWGRHMIPGAGLAWIWDHPDGGISESPYGYYPQALPNFTWDAISLQPFDRWLEGDRESDEAMSANFINLAKTRSPQAQFYVYSRWPRVPLPDNSNDPTDPRNTAASWNQQWAQIYGQPGSFTNETKDYFEKLTNRLRTNHTDIKPVRMVPVGQVFKALNDKMAAGQVPGFTNIWQVYSDGIHLKGVGSYIASCTFFATLYGQNPVGAPVPSNFGTIDPTVASIIQQTAWQVVTTEPLSGVTGCTSNCGTTLRPAETPSGTVAGVNYNYYEETWSALPAFSSLTPVKSGNVATFDMSVRNRTDNYAFQYTGYVNVPADGQYSFYTSSDDGSRLYIGTQLVVDNDGLHDASVERIGTIGLKAGKHSITVNYFEAAGGEVLNVSYSGPGVAKQLIPAAALSRIPAGPTNRPPTAVLNTSPSSATGVAPFNVSFNTTGSSDPDAGDFILGYEWDFGDGTPFSNSNAPTHTYTTPGTYTAKLRVMDNHNLYGSQVSKTITVTGGTTPGNIASSGTIIATVMTPVGGGGNPDIAIIRDGFKATVGSPADNTQYDTFDGSNTPAPYQEYIGYTFSQAYTFTQLVFQEGRHFSDGGFFENGSLKVQVQVGSAWNDVMTGASASPVAYPTATATANFGASYETYTFNLPANVVGTGLRIVGTAGGSNRFISVGELEVYGTPGGTTAGTGLRGQYFNNRTFTGSPALTRTDATVNFSWAGSPGTGVNADQFAVRWSGQVQAPVSGSYTFSTLSDDGVRLWVNGVQVVNNWTDHAATTNNAAPITLTAGQKYSLTMEYYEATGGAEARLWWAYPGQAQQVVPTARLFPPTGARVALEPTLQQALALYPNPATDQLTVAFTALADGQAQLSLLNSLGQAQLQTRKTVVAGKNTVLLPVGQLQRGLLFLLLEVDGQQLIKKIVLK